MSILGIGRSFKECFGIGKKEIPSTNLKAIFDNNIGEYFEIDRADTISKERLIGILNEITETTAGQNILKALKSALEELSTKIAFDVFDSLGKINNELNSEEIKLLGEFKIGTPLTVTNLEEAITSLGKAITTDSRKALLQLRDFLREYKCSYLFKSADALDNPNAPLVVTINKDQFSEERYVFDGEKIKTQSLAENDKTEENDKNKNKTEAYLIAHELAHVVSFLNFKIKNKNSDVEIGAKWDLRKGIKRGEEAIGWVRFFKETVEMREVYHGLLLDGFTPKQIIEAFGGKNGGGSENKGLFNNTEEARNVLGLIKCTVDGKEVSIGEGQLFKETMPEPEKSNSIITYLGKPRDLTDVEKAVLTVLMNKLHNQSKSVVSQYDHTDAQAALGDAFKGFDLVNASSAIEAIKAADTSLKKHDFLAIEQKINKQVSDLKGLNESSILESKMRTDAEVEHLSAIAQNIGRPIVLVQSDTEDPLKYTVKAFNNDGKVEEELLNYNLKELKDTEPKPIFLYHNGINHFHALVPQRLSKGLGCTIL